MKRIFQICAVILFSMALMKQVNTDEIVQSFKRSKEISHFSHGNF
jgi:hypothetical protein